MPKNVPPAVQHAALVLFTALLAWAGQVLPTVDTLPVPVTGVLGAVVAWSVGFLVPVVDGYGIGSGTGPQNGDA